MSLRGIFTDWSTSSTQHYVEKMKAGLTGFIAAPDASPGLFPFSVAMRKHTARVGVTGWPILGAGGFALAAVDPIAISFLEARVLREDGGMKVFENAESIDKAYEHREI